MYSSNKVESKMKWEGVKNVDWGGGGLVIHVYHLLWTDTTCHVYMYKVFLITDCSLRRN